MPSGMVTWLLLHWQNMLSLQAMVWTSVRQRCSTATHTPQHGACLRVGTFSGMRISSTENGEAFLRCTRHSWIETYHSYTPLYYHAHCPNISMPPSPLHLGYVHLLFYFIFLNYIIHSNVIHSHHHQLSPILSCHPTLFKQCRVLTLSFTDEGSS